MVRRVTDDDEVLAGQLIEFVFNVLARQAHLAWAIPCGCPLGARPTRELKVKRFRRETDCGEGNARSYGEALNCYSCWLPAGFPLTQVAHHLHSDCIER